ncbi:hypothetical protein [Rubrivirga sp. IMCC43871]|uniref:hypothetical protein n=1 Tax=Rubrivirga sp. IMCC43871 TaxID=3391575 RepID=UPI00398F9555
MRKLSLLAALALTAGCATMAPAPAEAPASPDALVDYLTDRHIDLRATVADAPLVAGADVAVYAVGRGEYEPSRPRRTGDSDFDPRSPSDLGVRHGDSYAYTYTRARGSAPPLVWVYTFDGPADPDRVRHALGLEGAQVYAGGSLVVVPTTPPRELARALEAAFGPAVEG